MAEQPPEPCEPRDDDGEDEEDAADTLPVTHVVTAEHAAQRLDRFVAALADAPSRSQLKAAIERGEVTVDGRVVKAGHALRVGERVELRLRRPTLPPELRPEPIPLTVLYEDDALLVLDKPAMLVVHPAPGHPRGTLVNALLHHCGPTLEGVGASGRPGIVHRLDRETSGVMVVARTEAAMRGLAVQFAAHSIDRAYLALCSGAHALPDDEPLRIETLHGRHPSDRKRFTGRVARGRRAVTTVEVLERFRDAAALVRCTLETGRTHQIRMHLSERGAPILGDTLYGGRAAATTRLIDRVALHAVRLGFRHPIDGRAMLFEQAPPQDFAAALEKLRSGASWRR